MSNWAIDYGKWECKWEYKWECKLEYKWEYKWECKRDLMGDTIGYGPYQISPSRPMHVIEGRSHLGSLVGSHASELGTELQLLPLNNFRHHVSCILTCVDLLQLESF